MSASSPLLKIRALTPVPAPPVLVLDSHIPLLLPHKSLAIPSVPTLHRAADPYFDIDFAPADVHPAGPADLLDAVNAYSYLPVGRMHTHFADDAPAFDVDTPALVSSSSSSASLSAMFNFDALDPALLQRRDPSPFGPPYTDPPTPYSSVSSPPPRFAQPPPGDPSLGLLPTPWSSLSLPSSPPYIDPSSPGADSYLDEPTSSARYGSVPPNLRLDARTMTFTCHEAPNFSLPTKESDPTRYSPTFDPSDDHFSLSRHDDPTLTDCKKHVLAVLERSYDLEAATHHLDDTPLPKSLVLKVFKAAKATKVKLSDKQITANRRRPTKNSTSPGLQGPPRHFQCILCDHALVRREGRSNHYKVHLELKEFPCGTHCDKRFTTDDGAVKHRKGIKIQRSQQHNSDSFQL